MEPERDEVYERIPWETLEAKGGNRQWMVYAVAGALVVGSLAYSFTRSQQPAPAPQVAEPAVTPTVPVETTTTPAAPSTTPSPVVMAEADLYAVDPERMIDLATAHAEWFAAEYISYDASPESSATLQDLLPEDVPLPQAPEGTQVFVDWARATGLDQTGPVAFDVEVVVRSLVAADGSAFVRQLPQRLVVPIDLDSEGRPRISRPPLVNVADGIESAELSLHTVPPDVDANLGVDGEVVGGLEAADGSWLVVVMATGADGVTRPTTVPALATP